MKKKIVQFGQVLTVSDMKMTAEFENVSNFWTAVTLLYVDGFGQFFFEIGQNFTTNLQVPSASRFGLAFLLKSIKGDFL